LVKESKKGQVEKKEANMADFNQKKSKQTWLQVG